MDQLLCFRSDGHPLHMKLLHLDAPFAVMPRATTDSHWLQHCRVLRPNSAKPTICKLGGFDAQTVVSHRDRRPTRPRHVSHQSSTTPAIQPAPPCPRASACPRCQPPRLVSGWSLGCSGFITPLVLRELKLWHDIICTSITLCMIHLECIH
jgi:hypothetical protein